MISEELKQTKIFKLVNLLSVTKNLLQIEG